MALFPIGVATAGLGLPVREALRWTASAGADGVELPVVGDLAPEGLSRTGRRELRHLFERHGLRPFSLDGRLPGCVPADPARAQEAVERTMPLLRLAADLRAPVVVTHLGAVGSEPEAAAWRTAAEALDLLGEAAGRCGVILAAVTGPDPPSSLARLLDSVSAGGLGVAYHPARLKRSGLDPVEGLDAVAPRLVHAYAADVTSGADAVWRAVPLGEGDLDWAATLGALARVDYAGPMIVARQGTHSTPTDVKEAVDFLRGL